MFKRGEFVYDSMMIEKKHHIVRDNMLRVIDINLDFLSQIDYNEVKKGYKYNLEKLLYFFVCKDKKLLEGIYDGNGLMKDISKIFDIDTESLDEQLYYDYDEYMKEVSYEQGEIDKQKQIVKNMLDNNLDKDLMLKITNLKDDEFNKIIEDIKYDEAKSNK